MTLPEPTWTAIVPVRAGSKGLPNKNTRLLAGKPLYRHAVDQALVAGASRVLISTDIAEILAAPFADARIEVQPRPSELAGDTVPMAPVISHVIQAAGCSGPVVLLQATSPLREPSHIRQALRVFAAGGVELVMSVTQAERSVLKWGYLEGDRFRPIADPAYCFSNRQSLPALVRPNGAIYVVDAAGFVQRGGFVTPHIGVVEMDAESSLDIDGWADFERCAAVLATRADA